jgi:hypothetical protein
LLVKFDIKSLSEEQLTFLYIYYWAAFSGHATGGKMVDFFIREIGFSPFVCLYKGHCPVVGSIIGGRLNMFKSLVVNSNEGFKTVHAEYVSDYTKEHGADIDKNIYAFINKSDMKLFEKSRQCEDKYGNNILHFIFFLPDMPEFYSKYQYLLEKDKSPLSDATKIRNLFLDIAIEEDLGDLRLINHDNYLPY